MSEPGVGSAAPLPRLPRRMPLADDTYDILRTALITNGLPPGQRLNIEELARDLNVSITPIRHALVRLEADGLVTREPYKGYVASKMLDRATIAEIFAARLLLESETVAKAAAQATKEDVAFLSRIVEMDPRSTFAEDSDDDYAGLSCDAVIHRRIAEIAGNQTLVDVLESLTKRVLSYRSFKQQQLGEGHAWRPAVAATKREHTAIVKAIRHADADAARAAMRRHLENASNRDVDSWPDDD